MTQFQGHNQKMHRRTVAWLLGSRLKPRFLGDTAQLLRSNGLGAVGPEAGLMWWQDWECHYVTVRLLKLRTLLTHGRFGFFFAIATRNPCFNKMSSPRSSVETPLQGWIGMGCSGSKTKVQTSSTTSKALQGMSSVECRIG